MTPDIQSIYRQSQKSWNSRNKGRYVELSSFFHSNVRGDGHVIVLVLRVVHRRLGREAYLWFSVVGYTFVTFAADLLASRAGHPHHLFGIALVSKAAETMAQHSKKGGTARTATLDVASPVVYPLRDG